MKAVLIYQRKQQFLTTKGVALVVQMDLFEIQGQERASFPGGFKFSWIAFNANDPDQKVLFDSHPPKGPHFHVNNEKEVPFEWKSVDEAEKFFYKKMVEQFGDLSQ